MVWGDRHCYHGKLAAHVVMHSGGEEEGKGERERRREW